MKFSKIFVLVIVLLVATQARVHAYTDPGSGTLIWQMLLAAGFGLMFYLRRIVGWFHEIKNRKSVAADTEATVSVRENSKRI